MVLATMAGLFFIDRLLARTEQYELRHEAAGLAAEGQQLLASGRAQEAATRYRRAHALFRADTGYALDYGQALLAAGDRQRAEAMLREVLDRDSNDARANLLMARTMRAAGDRAAAGSYYHRAIYGAWPADAGARRMQTRLELADWLAQQHARDELLAELLPLQAAVPRHPELSQHVADLLLAAGSPARAAEAYRALLKAQPGNAAAYRGLGEAELQRGNYRAAERIFEEALERSPGDNATAARVATVKAVNALDPTPRRLPSMEKYRRGMQLVALSAAALRTCSGPSPAKNVADLLADADRAAQRKVAGSVANETSEARLALAQELWRARAVACPSEPKPNEPLQIVMDRLLSP